MDILATLISDKPVVIFSKSTCCISHSVKALICSFGASPTVIEVDKMANGQQIERALIQLGCRPTVPAVFIEQKLIGGAEELISLNVQNKLAQHDYGPWHARVNKCKARL
ncbi:Monothiol glutaredoxin-S1, partial [Mucuna pruriens]